MIEQINKDDSKKSTQKYAEVFVATFDTITRGGLVTMLGYFIYEMSLPSVSIVFFIFLSLGALMFVLSPFVKLSKGVYV